MKKNHFFYLLCTRHPPHDHTPLITLSLESSLLWTNLTVFVQILNTESTALLIWEGLFPSWNLCNLSFLSITSKHFSRHYNYIGVFFSRKNMTGVIILDLFLSLVLFSLKKEKSVTARCTTRVAHVWCTVNLPDVRLYGVPSLDGREGSREWMWRHPVFWDGAVSQRSVQLLTPGLSHTSSHRSTRPNSVVKYDSFIGMWSSTFLHVCLL